jgi:hypothetical protein
VAVRARCAIWPTAAALLSKASAISSPEMRSMRSARAVETGDLQRLNGEINTIVAVRVDNGLVTGLYALRNPAKLSRIQRETALRR